MSSVKVNTLPEGWKVEELEKLIDLIQNGISSKQNDEMIGYPVSRIETIQNSTFDKNRIKYVDADNDAFNKYKYDVGDISFSHINSYEIIGKVAIYRGDIDNLLHGVNLLRLKFNDKIYSEYGYYFFKSSLARKEYEPHIKRAINQASINQKNLKSILVPFPPLEEQKRIVAKIDGLFAKIDKAIILTEESLKQAKNLLPSIIDETFDSFDAEKVDLKSISESIQYGYTGKTIEDGQYYYLRITDIQGGVVNYQAAPYSDIEGVNIAKYKLNKGDILFARTGATAGKSYLFNDDVDAVFASYLIRVVCNQDIVRPSFVKWFFLSANYWKQIYGNIIGAAQPNFNGKKLGELNLKVPSLGQQELVIDYLEKVSKQTKETQSKLEEQLK